MAKKYYTEKELKNALKALARGKSSYLNQWPYNLLYWDGERFWADCVNLYKSLLNGRDINNPKKGSYQSNLSNTGDVTEWGMMKQCSDISSNFNNLGNKLRCLYKNGHFGGYLGEQWNEPGQGIVNAVESTPAWEDGIQFSYVAPDGARSWNKGGSIRGYWECHGLPDAFVDYSNSTTAQTSKPTTETETTTTKTILKTDFIACLPAVAYGSKGDVVKILQKELQRLGYYKGTIDGDAGIVTVTAIQQLQTNWRKVYGNVLVDGSFGPQCWTRLFTGK